MTDPGKAAQHEDLVIAEGVDEEPVEPNRRIFEGRHFIFIGALSTIYAFFHIAALNGLGISALTGGLVQIPYLPEFPMETWNFRIVHIAGALGLGFMLFAGRGFAGQPRR